MFYEAFNLKNLIDMSSFFPYKSNDYFLLESEEIEEKFNPNKFEDPFIERLECNQMQNYYEQNRYINISSCPDYNYNRNIFNPNIENNKDEESSNYDYIFTNTNTKTKTNTNYRYLFDIKRKRYRDNKKENLDINNLGRKFCKDNIISKIKNHYTKCTIDLFNQILISKKIEKIKFYYLDHNISKKSKDEDVKEMKNSSIEKIISKKVSQKYCKDKDNNAKVCSTIKNNEELKDIAKLLDLNFLFFFEKIYRQKRKEIYNLSDYDLTGISNIEFQIPKEIELYKDLLKKNENEPFYEKYKTEMEICCKLYFIPNEKGPKFKAKKIKRKKKSNNI